MWIKSRRKLTNVQRIGIEPSPGMPDEDGYSIIDLDVTNPVYLISGLLDDLIFELNGGKHDLFENPQLTRICNSGELGYYTSYERAKEVFDEIQQAIIDGKTFFEMPEE